GGGGAGGTGSGTGGTGGGAGGTGGGTGGTGGGTGGRIVLSCLDGAVAEPCTCGSKVSSAGYCCAGKPEDRACPIAPAYYVSPDGNDSRSGTSVDTAFQTLEKARDAARASPTRKTVYLLRGTFPRSATLHLAPQDRGQSWLAYPGHTPILEGNGRTTMALAIDAGDVTVRFVTFQNFVDSAIGLVGGDADRAIIDSNTITNTLSTDRVQAAIDLCCGEQSDARITHNLIEGADYIGIRAGAAAAGGGVESGTTLAYNGLYDTCRLIKDCGAIYVWDVAQQSSGVTLANNVVGNPEWLVTPGGDAGAQGLYLDGNQLRVTVRDNIVYGHGDWAVEIRGGSDNRFENNIFDISQMRRRLALYTDTDSTTPLSLSNVFTCNIVYSNDRTPSPLWDVFQTLLGELVLPQVHDNVYWATRGLLSNTGRIRDASPIVKDPGFVDPTKADYRFTGESAWANCDFAPIDARTVGPLPNP
ncbi:MAG: right-handed parallel beta-helix repeat-containing protein, partial [Sorangiineae bacterium]|nr:right-handed parallel beta-helix repeat-containing protein [Sorangiineae bacterium]